jgi:L-threonylcarbamoyladenylate synthase
MASVLTSIKDKRLAVILGSGSIGVLPTDTLYGLVCIASDVKAVSRLYKIKSREKKPGTIVASSIEQLVHLGIKRRYLTAVSQYWPGPISIVVPTDNPDLEYVDMGVGSLALRVVADKGLINLLDQTGPLLTSSANMPGKNPANNMAEVQKYFGDSVDFYVDGGDFSDRKPSTLIKIIDDSIEVLRVGAVKIDNETGRL